MTSLLALPEPSWLQPWMQQPAFLYSIGFGLLMLLVVAVLKARDLPSWWRARGRNTLDPGQLEELMLGTPPNILDLRSEQEYRSERGHIRYAVNIPFPHLQQRLDELDTSHPRPIVLVDEDDALSHRAFALVAARGHAWLYVLRGGMKAWRRAKLPTYVFEGKDGRGGRAVPGQHAGGQGGTSRPVETGGPAFPGRH